MGKGVNRVTLLGNVGKDPEVTYTQSGMCIAKFGLATTESKKSGDNWEEETLWHRITFFGKIAENFIAKYVTKGSTLYIEGKLAYGSYEKDGVKHYTRDIIGFSVQSVGGKKEEPKPVNKTQKPPPDDNVLPF